MRQVQKKSGKMPDVRKIKLKGDTLFEFILSALHQFAQLPEERQKEIRARSCEYNRQLRNSRTPEEREQLNAERRQNYDPFTQRLYKMNSTVDPEKLKANRHRVYLRMKDDPVRMAKRMERIHQYNEAHRAEINERQRRKRAGVKSKDEMQLLKLGGLL